MATRIFENTAPGPDAVEIKAWRDIPVTIASDVRGGRNVVHAAIRPVRPFPLGQRMAGPAVTARCERADFGPCLHAIDLARAHEIVVIDAGGCLETAYVGELLCGAARRVGLGGLIVNGAVRDIDTIASWPDFPVYCLGNQARGPLTKERGSVNETIAFAGVVVRPGDLVLGDNDGLIIIPREEGPAWLADAQARVAMEMYWAEELTKGRSLVDVFNVPEAI
jgi:4-hydroxy-4-methyl-2-oxoglutarate aldolase